MKQKAANTWVNHELRILLVLLAVVIGFMIAHG